MAIFQAETTIKIPFYDNDPMGVVWHGNYVKYIEIARCDALEKITPETLTPIEAMNELYKLKKMLD